MKKIYLFCIIFGVVLFPACDDDNDGNNGGDSYDVLYIQTNNFNGNQNGVIAYRVGDDGTLSELDGSPFMTNGSGVGNPAQILGPNDSDYELRLSADGNFLLAVNSGTNTIAVFDIADDGSLSHVSGSPFPSGGETPVSIDVRGNRVFVVNKSQNPLSPTTTAPNYTVFSIDGSGQLTPVANSTVETTPGSSPSNGLVSRDGDYLFGTDFLGAVLPTPVGTLRSFVIEDNGMLTPVAGTPYMLPLGPMPPDNGALGLWQHPSAYILYVGMPMQAKVGVFNINQSTGALDLATTVNAGKAACWIRTNSSGDRMYVLNSGDNTVQVYNTSNAAAPTSMQVLQLKQSGPDYTGPGGLPFKTSEAFSHHISTDGNRMFVVSQHTNPDFSIGNFNYLHVLEIAEDGMLSEPGEPIQLPVANTLRPKGTVVISAND